MPAFSADKDDETRLRTYILQRVPPILKKELGDYLQPVPDSWLMHEQSEANAANGLEDLLLEEQLDDASFEVEDISFQEELTSMPAFQAVADDEQRMSTYILQWFPSMAPIPQTPKPKPGLMGEAPCHV